MKIITIELLNDNALNLLKQLERLNILRLITVKQQSNKNKKRKWAGSLSKETTAKMLQHVQQSRNEWDRNI